MAEINSLNVVDADNTSRFPENQLPSTVNNGARALEGIIARWDKDTNASLSAGGSANAITISANQTLSAYYDGFVIAFEAGATNTGAVTINVDSVGVKSLKKNVTDAMDAGDIVNGQKVIAIYDGTNFQIVSAYIDITQSTLAENWATKTDGVVESSEYSSKAYAIGGTGVTDTAGKGAAKEWATAAEDDTVDGSEYSAKHYSTKASASASSASTSASAASASASAASASVLSYNFSTTTTMADPGSGNVRFNNGTISSVSAIAIDDLDASGNDRSAVIISFDDSTNTVKGSLSFTTASGDIASFDITGLTDNSGWVQIAVTHVSSNGTFSNSEATFIGFARAGDKGTDGSGDVSGPASATDNALARYDGTGGKILQNSGVTADDSGNIAANNLSGTNTGDESAASATASGIVELATSAEVTTGTDTVRAVTPAGLHAGLAGLTDTTITAADAIIFSDATDSGKLKEDTVQGILDLALPYVAPSTSGNVLTSNGSAWTSAAPAGGGAWEFVEKETASSSTTMTFSHTIEAGYDYYITCTDIKNSADTSAANAPKVQLGTGAGPTFVTSGYKGGGFRYDTTVISAANAPTAGFTWWVLSTLGGAVATEKWHGDMVIHNPAANEFTQAILRFWGENSAGDYVGGLLSQAHETAAVVTALRVVATSGNFTSGEFILYRRARA